MLKERKAWTLDIIRLETKEGRIYEVGKPKSKKDQRIVTAIIARSLTLADRCVTGYEIFYDGDDDLYMNGQISCSFDLIVGLDVPELTVKAKELIGVPEYKKDVI